MSLWDRPIEKCYCKVCKKDDCPGECPNCGLHDGHKDSCDIEEDFKLLEEARNDKSL